MTANRPLSYKFGNDKKNMPEIEYFFSGANDCENR